MKVQPKGTKEWVGVEHDRDLLAHQVGSRHSMQGVECGALSGLRQPDQAMMGIEGHEALVPILQKY